LQKGSLVWGNLAPKDPLGDTEYDPAKELQELDIGDYSRGISDKERKLKEAQLHAALKALAALPSSPSSSRKIALPRGSAVSSPKKTPKKTPRKPTKEVGAPSTLRTLRARKARPAPLPIDETMEDADASDAFAAGSDTESDDELLQDTPSKKQRKR
jgi:hypothetical protein